MKVRGEKSGGAENNGLAVLRRVFEEFFDGEPLREESHGKAIGGEAKGVGERFPKCL